MAMHDVSIREVEKQLIELKRFDRIFNNQIHEMKECKEQLEIRIMELERKRKFNNEIIELTTLILDTAKKES